MNSQQELAYRYVEEGKNVFVTGGAGSGKSFFVKTIIERLRHRFCDKDPNHKKIGITSMTGSSALLIGGTTLHSFLGIGITRDVDGMMTRIGKYGKKRVWKKLDVLIIDEVSMLSRELFECIDIVAKQLRKSTQPFGGIQLILCGDFCQLGCVDSKEFCFESPIWSCSIHHTIEFTTIYRQEQDSTFINVLNQVRFGNITKEVQTLLKQRVKLFQNNDKGIIPTQLFPHRKSVYSINLKHLETLLDMKHQHHIFLVKSKDENPKLVKYLGEDATKMLCVDAQVILTVNLDIENGLVNGSRGKVVEFTDNDLPIVEFVDGTRRMIEYYDYEWEDENNNIHKYSHLPLTLGWAITIHKSQGMTLDCVITELANIFDYGQGYVTLSRVKSLENIWISKIDFSKLKCHPKVIDFYKKLSPIIKE